LAPSGTQVCFSVNFDGDVWGELAVYIGEQAALILHDRLLGSRYEMVKAST